VLRFEHHSDVLSCEMKFSVFLPSQAQEGQKVPVREPPSPRFFVLRAAERLEHILTCAS
jgi:hypothetical protein